MTVRGEGVPAGVRVNVFVHQPPLLGLPLKEASKVPGLHGFTVHPRENIVVLVPQVEPGLQRLFEHHQVVIVEPGDALLLAPDVLHASGAKGRFWHRQDW